MEFLDHDYTSRKCDDSPRADFSYRMNSKETEEFVKLRVSNKYLFSGRRNTSMWAWRAILKHMGLQDKMAHCQASKKWENMKKKYKELKNPPGGVHVFPETWPHFHLMDDAMEGRLEGTAPILEAHPSYKYDHDLLPISSIKQRRLSMVIKSLKDSLTCGPEVEVSLNGDENGEAQMLEEEGRLEIDRIMQAVDQESNMVESERQVMEREKLVMERERLVLKRERAVLERETAALERERALLERERAVIEREKDVLEKERVMVESDRDAVSKERLALGRERARLGRLSAAQRNAEELPEATDSDVRDRKERFLSLFEKLVENF